MRARKPSLKLRLQKAGITEEMVREYARNNCLSEYSASLLMLRHEAQFRAKERDLFANDNIETNPFLLSDQGELL